MTFPYVSREEWGANYTSDYHTVGMEEKDEFFVHYHGGEPSADRGRPMALNVQKIHHDNDWSGVGYSWLVGQDGGIYEGRGWNGVAVACPDHNRRGIHVYGAIGGDQDPSVEMLLSILAIRDEHRRRRKAINRSIPAEFVHGDKYATACAGPKLTPWVHAGMPYPEEDPFMAVDLDAFATKIRNSVLFDGVIQIIGRPEGEKMSLATSARVTYDRVVGHGKRIDELEAKVDGLNAALTARDAELAEVVAQQVKDRLSRLSVRDEPVEPAQPPAPTA